MGRFDTVQTACAHAAEMAAAGAHVIDVGGESTRPGAAFVPVEEELSRTAPIIEALAAAGITAPISIDTRKSAVAQETGAPICLMHAQGDPRTMQQDPQERLSVALEAGLPREQIILDPGIGFGKTAAHNLALINGLSLFHGLGCPLLLGVSRKRFIGTIGNAPEAAQRAPGSISVALKGLAQAVQIVRALRQAGIFAKTAMTTALL